LLLLPDPLRITTALPCFLTSGNLSTAPYNPASKQAYSRRGCEFFFVCLACGGVCYLLDTFILTPSMRLYVRSYPAFRQNLLTPRHAWSPRLQFQPIILSFLARFNSLPTPFTGLSYWAWSRISTLYTCLRPRSTALGSQRSPR
jgi:hypothetical protein